MEKHTPLNTIHELPRNPVLKGDCRITCDIPENTVLRCEGNLLIEGNVGQQVKCYVEGMLVIESTISPYCYFEAHEIEVKGTIRNASHFHATKGPVVVEQSMGNHNTFSCDSSYIHLKGSAGNHCQFHALLDVCIDGDAGGDCMFDSRSSYIQISGKAGENNFYTHPKGYVSISGEAQGKSWPFIERRKQARTSISESIITLARKMGNLSPKSTKS